LSRDQEGRLLGCYAPHVQSIAEVLCFQGLRVGEALRLDWAQVDWARSGGRTPTRVGTSCRAAARSAGPTRPLALGPGSTTSTFTTGGTTGHAGAS
jgi:hypothetical protein